MSACAKARLALAQYVNSLTPASVADKGGSMIKSSMIAGVSAPLKGVVGNATWGGYKMLLQQPLEAGMDWVQSFGRSIASGGKVKPHELREVVSTFTPDGFRAYGKGFKAGSKSVADGVRAGRAAQRALKPGSGFGEWAAAFMDQVQLQLNADVTRLGVNTPTQVRIENPALRAMTEAGFAAVEAVDRPFFEGAHSVSLQMQAKLSAVRQGLKGAARDAEVARLTANPTPDMVVRALDDAMYATFKDKAKLVKMAEGAKRAMLQIANDPSASRADKAGASAASLVMDLTIPFTGVPTSIAAKGASLTPLGLLSPKMVGTQAERSRALANVTLGSGLVAIGYAMEKNRRLEGTSPAGKNQREDLMATGQPQAVKVGDAWVRITDGLGPLAAPLMAGAALARQERDNPEATTADRAVAVAGAVGKNTVETSFMQGTKRLIDAVEDPDGFGNAFVAGMLGPVIPSVVSQMSRIMDPVEREAKTIGERLMNRTPARVLLPEKGTPFGAQPEKTLGERLSPMLPAAIKQDRSTPETEELRRLGVSVGTPEREMTVRGQKVPLTDEQYRTLVERQGERVLPAVRRLMAGPGYDALPDEEKKRRLRIIVDRAKDAARAPVRRDAALLTGVTP